MLVVASALLAEERNFLEDESERGYLGRNPDISQGPVRVRRRSLLSRLRCADQQTLLHSLVIGTGGNKPVVGGNYCSKADLRLESPVQRRRQRSASRGALTADAGGVRVTRRLADLSRHRRARLVQLSSGPVPIQHQGWRVSNVAPPPEHVQLSPPLARGLQPSSPDRIGQQASQSASGALPPTWHLLCRDLSKPHRPARGPLSSHSPLGRSRP